MNFAMIGHGLKFAAIKGGFLLRKYAPQILTGTGIAGFVATVAVGCKSTLKAEDILEEHEKMIGMANEAYEKSEPGQYTEDDYNKDLFKAKRKTFFKFVKLYAPTVTLGVASIACILSSHHMMATRNAAIAAAYKAGEAAFRAYRKNVVDEFGEEVDKRMNDSLKAEDIQKVSELQRKPKTKEEKKKAAKCKAPDRLNDMLYKRIFDKNSPRWPGNDESMVISALKLYESELQDYYNKNKGKMTLADALRIGGFTERYGYVVPREAYVLGWSRFAPNSDGRINIGLDNIQEESIGKLINRRFIRNGEDIKVLLNFNCDGPILEYVPTSADIGYDY